MLAESEVRNWADLNIDCLINVFERLGLESLLLDIPYVCKSWYKASLDPHCWKVLDFQPMPQGMWMFADEAWPQNYPKAPPFTQFIKIAVHRSRGLATKLVFHTFKFENNILEYVLERCPALKTLTLLDFDDLHYHRASQNSKPILKMISKLKNLESLMFLKYSSKLKDILNQISIHCPNFASLGLQNFNSDTASAIVTKLPNIKHLFINRSFLPSESIIPILSGCRKLELLHVTDCTHIDDDDDDAEILKMASHIKDLILERQRAVVYI